MSSEYVVNIICIYIYIIVYIKWYTQILYTIPYMYCIIYYIFRWKWPSPCLLRKMDMEVVAIPISPYVEPIPISP